MQKESFLPEHFLHRVLASDPWILQQDAVPFFHYSKEDSKNKIFLWTFFYVLFLFTQIKNLKFKIQTPDFNRLQELC